MSNKRTTTRARALKQAKITVSEVTQAEARGERRALKLLLNHMEQKILNDPDVSLASDEGAAVIFLASDLCDVARDRLIQIETDD